MAFNINGVVCQEIVSGYSEEYDLQHGLSSRKGYLCDWADRFTVGQGLLGLASTTSVGGAITLYRPARHPQLVNTYCTRITIEPKGSPVRGTYQLVYPQCIVWAEYSPMPWSFSLGDNAWQQLDPLSPLVYAEQRMSSSYEMMEIPGSGCKWKNTGLYLQQPASRRIALCDMEISIKQLPYMPTAQVFAMGGSINLATYLGVAAGKLLFNGVQTQQITLSDGTYAQEGAFRFTARTIRWDYQYDPAQLDFDQVLVKGGTDPLVPSVDFGTIIPGVYHQEPLTRLDTLI